jgi:hypothetical protein
MSENDTFENEFAKMVAEETTAEVPAVSADAASVPPAAGTPAAKVKIAKAAKLPKESEGPNPYGIHMLNGEVVTMTYLRKWAQCATRGMKFNRVANINHLMSEATLVGCTGWTTGQYSAFCHNYEGWKDPSGTEVPEPAKKARIPMTAEEKAAKAAELKAAKAAKKAAANVKVTTQVVDAGAAAADEAAILGVDTAEPEVAPSDEAGFASN